MDAMEYPALRAEAARSSTDDQALVARCDLRHLLAAYDELRGQLPDAAGGDATDPAASEDGAETPPAPRARRRRL